MKFYVLTGALLVSLFATSGLFAGEPSSKMLNKMGLSGMKTMSDSQGMQVRGMGSYAYVAGTSTANFFGGQTSTNGYNAGTSNNHGGSIAIGASLSLAGAGGSFGGGSGFVIAGAGGGAFAFAGPVGGHH